MANLFPTALNSYITGSNSITLVSAGHAAAHNAYESKLGTGSSSQSPTSGTVLRGNGTGTSLWGQVVLTTDITGILPSANGGTGKVTLTQPATGSTLTIADGKTLTANNNLTFSGTDGKSLVLTTGLTVTTNDGTLAFGAASKTLTVSDSTTLATNAITFGGGEIVTFSASNALSLLTTGTTVMTFPAATDTVVTLAATQTVTNKRRTRRLVTTTQSATPTINTDNGDIFKITGLAQAITSFTTNLSGTPVDGDLMEIRVTDNGTARGLTFGTSFESTTVTLPTTTVISTELKMLFEWNSVASKWDCVATA